MATWYYARGSERFGPVTIEEMRALATSGALRADDLVWTDGMAQWTPAGNQPDIGIGASADVMPQRAGAGAAGPAVAHARTAPAGAVGYYVPTADMPPRAASHLFGHARPTGDVGDWPLDDPRVESFKESLKLRRKITGASQLYRALFVLGIVASAVLLIVVPFTMIAGPRGRNPGTAFGVMVPAAIIIGLTVLYFFAWRATGKSQRWAPLTMGIVFLALIGLNILSFVVAVAAGSGDPTPAIIGSLFGSILPVIFAVVSFRAYSMIPRYLAQPAWCQELIAAGKF